MYTFEYPPFKAGDWFFNGVIHERVQIVKIENTDISVATMHGAPYILYKESYILFALKKGKWKRL